MRSFDGATARLARVSARSPTAEKTWTNAPASLQGEDGHHGPDEHDDAGEGAYSQVVQILVP
jgi:hypothetical protein